MNRKHYLEERIAYMDEDGNVYATEEEVPSEDYGIITLFPNPTWEPSDLTDQEGKNWIRAERLAELFAELTMGIPVEHICSACRIGRPKFRQYLEGERPIPEEIWQMVERIKKARENEKAPDFAEALKKAKLTKRAASIKFDVCYNTIQNWCSRGRLPQHIREWTEKILSK